MVAIVRVSPARPAVIVIGGQASAVSVARALARHGVVVHALNRPAAPIRWSHRSRWIALGADAEPEDWLDFLLGARARGLHGAVLLACSDEAVAMIAAHDKALSALYRLEEGDPALRDGLLDPLIVERLAVRALVPTPAMWSVGSIAEIHQQLGALRFPVTIQPRDPTQAERLGVHRQRVDDMHELMTAVREVLYDDVPFVIVEQVDDRPTPTSGYHAYLDEQGQPLFEFTTIQPRLDPRHGGAATCHLAGWLPDTATLGRQLFQSIGLRGLCHAEFQRDRRDGRLRLIACHARFTSANALLVSCGIDAALLTYRRLTGAPLPAFGPARWDQRLLFPYEDFAAFRRLRRGGQPPWSDWWHALRSADCLPYFAWTDPGPSLAVAATRLAGRISPE